MSNTQTSNQKKTAIMVLKYRYAWQIFFLIRNKQRKLTMTVKICEVTVNFWG